MKLTATQHSTGNLGDDIQAVALDALLPQVDLRVDRDRVCETASWSPDVFWLVAGWFDHNPLAHWRERNGRCLMIGFHAQTEKALPKRVDHPIGCRDRWTYELCRRHGVPAWRSHCVTLTLQPPEPVTLRHGVLFVDVDPKWYEHIPADILAEREESTHTIRTRLWRYPKERRRVARERLALYASALLVVTRRLHVMLPCLAFGTPVVMLRNDNEDFLRRCSDYLDLAWDIRNAPWDDPYPRVPVETVRTMAQPIRDCLAEFLGTSYNVPAEVAS